jgi:hypothetical protein
LYLLIRRVIKLTSNYRGMSLLLTTYRILSNIHLLSLTPYIKEIIGNHQCGFQHNQPTTDQIWRWASWVQCLTYGLDDLDLIPAGAKDFSSSLCIQTGSGAHPTSYPIGPRYAFPRAKAWPGHNANHSPPSSAEVRSE